MLGWLGTKSSVFSAFVVEGRVCQKEQARGLVCGWANSECSKPRDRSTEPELCEKSLVGPAYTQLPVLMWVSMGQKPQTFHRACSSQCPNHRGDGTVGKSMRA